MKIGIISDTHGHEGAWTRAYEKFFTGADLILHAGDVAYHGPRNPMKADYNPMGLIERINASVLKQLIVTDTIPLGDKKSDKIVVLTIADAIGDVLISIQDHRSVSHLFR